MPRPTVTVIIPTYNRARLVAEAIGSVLDQTEPAEQIVVVDDGSTDATAERLAAYAQRIEVVRIEHCGMAGRVRNVGAGRATGDLLAFLDSDDLWRPEKLARQRALHRADPTLRISHTRETWLRNGRIVSQAGQRHARSGDIFDDALVKCIMGPSTVMVDRPLFSAAGGFREDLEIGEDYELWLRIVDSERVGYIDEELTIKRAGLTGSDSDGSGQLSAKYGQIEIFRIRALRELIERSALSAGRLPSARRELARKCMVYAAGCSRRGRAAEAAEYRALASRCLGVAPD
ncbi:glycosyltransferase family 2 protein [Salinispira pacifica]